MTIDPIFSIHCDICKSYGSTLKNFVQIFKGDSPAQCTREGMPPGTYDDLSLRICLPTKKDLLPFLDQVRFYEFRKYWDDP
jgi:hypothetical protein